MVLLPRFMQIRNLSVAVVNGAITLVILLIAPLGLAAVVINTALVTVSSYVTAVIADRAVVFLQGDINQAELLGRSDRSSSRHRLDARDSHSHNLDRF